jgi:predicted nuclease with TOPRIM domain
MNTSEIVALILGSTAFIEFVKWLLKRYDSRDATKQQQSVAQIDDDAKMRQELWNEIQQLRMGMQAQQARTEELVKLNGQLSGQNMAQEAKVENLVQRLTAVTLDRDMNAKRVVELENKVEELEQQVALLQGRRRTKPSSLGGAA